MSETGVAVKKNMMPAEAAAGIKVDGMICPQCEDDIRLALIRERGIIDVSSSYRRSSVSVRFDPEIVSEEDIRRMLEGAGYPPGEGGSGKRADIACLAVIALLCLLLPRITSIGGTGDLTGIVSLAAALGAGFAGSLHCIGMCGGIMLTQTSNSGKGPLAASALYNGGRMAAYSAAGAVLGAIGHSFSYSDEFRSMFFTICGALIVLMALRMWGIMPWLRNLSIELPGLCRAGKLVKNRKALLRPLLTGLLTGLMPCGMMAAMWVAAAASGSAARGAALMLAFAAGTVPVMFLFGSFGSLMPRRYNKYMIKTSTALIAALGILMMAKSLVTV